MRPFVLVATLGIVASRALPGQELRGVVRDSASGQPIAGAVLTLLDSSQSVLGRNLTNERGEYRISLGGAARRTNELRIVRIGFRPRIVGVPRPFTATMELVIAMVSLPTMLEAVRVSDQPNCSRRNDRAAAFALWEQTKSALLAAIVSRASNPAAMLRIMFEQKLEGNSNRISSQTVRLDSTSRSTASFQAALNATDFVRHGFREVRGETEWYLGPDAEVMLDDRFAAGYCFAIASVDRARPRQVGLAFEAADRRRDRIDIAGTVWIDTAARVLRDIEFRYIGLDRRLEALDPGGRLSFREMPNGIMLIDRWRLRLVSSDSEIVLSPQGRQMYRSWLFAQENGGELARARWTDGTTWQSPLATLHVHATKRDRTPAAGLPVRLRDTDYRATTDSAGDFEISNIFPGPYALVVTDPRLAKIDVAIPTPIAFTAVRDSTHRATLTAITAEDFVAQRCLADRRYTVGESTWLFIRVVGADGRPLRDVRVTLSQSIGGAWVPLPDSYTTGADGLFSLCRHLRPQTSVMLHLRRDGSRDVDIPVRLGDGLTVELVTFEQK